MNCKQCQKLLFLYFEGQFNKVDRRQVALHLETCEACQKVSQEVQALFAVPAPEMPVPDGFIFQVHRRLNEISGAESKLHRMWKRLALPVLKPAALLLIFVSSTLIGNWLARGNKGTAFDQNTPQVIEEIDPVEILDAQSEKTLVGAYLAVVEQEK